jgi:hypothetical protein
MSCTSQASIPTTRLEIATRRSSGISTTAARHVGLPMDLDELEGWRPSPPTSQPEPEDSPRSPRSRVPPPNHDQTQEPSFATAEESPSIHGWG